MSADKDHPNSKDTTISSADNLVKTTKNGDIELTEAELKRVAGGRADASLDAGVHFKYDIKAQKEA